MQPDAPSDADEAKTKWPDYARFVINDFHEASNNQPMSQDQVSQTYDDPPHVYRYQLKLPDRIYDLYPPFF